MIQNKILFVLLFIFLSACCNENMYQLSARDKSRLLALGIRVEKEFAIIPAFCNSAPQSDLRKLRQGGEMYYSSWQLGGSATIFIANDGQYWMRCGVDSPKFYQLSQSQSDIINSIVSNPKQEEILLIKPRPVSPQPESQPKKGAFMFSFIGLIAVFCAGVLANRWLMHGWTYLKNAINFASLRKRQAIRELVNAELSLRQNQKKGQVATTLESAIEKSLNETL